MCQEHAIEAKGPASTAQERKITGPTHSHKVVQKGVCRDYFTLYVKISSFGILMKTAGLGHIELLSGPVLGSAWGIFLPGESFQAIHAWGMPSRIFDVRPAQRRQIFSMASPEHG
jgi:hypothetical protein